MMEIASNCLLSTRQKSNNCAALKSSMKTSQSKKRKGVQFASISSEENTASTSDYIYQEGKQWRHLASYFDCDDDRHDGESLMNELLDLCNWDDKNEQCDLQFSDADSDDEIPYDSFAVQCQQPFYSRAPTPMKSERVSSLRLKSKLRLDSKPILVAHRKIRKNGDSTKKEAVKNSISDKEQLELAFQGIMNNCDNEFVCEINSRRSLGEHGKTHKSNKKNDDDFWGDVEF